MGAYLLVVLLVAGGIVWLGRRMEEAYRRAVHQAQHLEESGEREKALALYRSLLDTELEGRIRRASRIVFLTDRVQELLALTGRWEEERRVLERSLQACMTVTRGDAWARWQRRLVELDESPVTFRPTEPSDAPSRPAKQPPR